MGTLFNIYKKQTKLGRNFESDTYNKNEKKNVGLINWVQSFYRLLCTRRGRMTNGHCSRQQSLGFRGICSGLILCMALTAASRETLTRLESRKIIYSFAQDTWAETADFTLKTSFSLRWLLLFISTYIFVSAVLVSLLFWFSQTKRGRTLTSSSVC